MFVDITVFFNSEKFRKEFLDLMNQREEGCAIYPEPQTGPFEAHPHRLFLSFKEHDHSLVPGYREKHGIWTVDPVFYIRKEDYPFPLPITAIQYWNGRIPDEDIFIFYQGNDYQFYHENGSVFVICFHGEEKLYEFPLSDFDMSIFPEKWQSFLTKLFEQLGENKRMPSQINLESDPVPETVEKLLEE